MDSEQKKIRLKRNIILLVIFMVAMVLRMGLNVARQEIFFKTPFLLSGDQFLKGRLQSDDRLASDAAMYIYSAKGFLNGKGIVGMNREAGPLPTQDYKKPFSGYIDIEKVDEDHYVHKQVPPLYPLFLSICFLIGGFNTLAYFIPQLILSCLTCLLIYLISEQIFNKTVALLAGFAVAFYPDLIFWSSFARTETLFIFLFVLGFLLLIKGNSLKNLPLIYTSAVVFGLACLTRVTFTPFLIILLFWLLHSFSKRKREGLKVVFLFGLIVFAVLLPWGIRNYVLFGEFTVLSEESGILIGTTENKEQYSEVEINRGYNSHASLFLKIPVFIKDNFKVYLKSCWRRFLIFWSPFTKGMKPLAKVYKGITWLIIFPAAFCGMIISRKKRSYESSLIIIFIIYHSLLHTASFADLGLIYRYPIQPFLCIFAAYTFCEIYRSINK